VNTPGGDDCPHAGGAGSDDEITVPAGTYPITILGNDNTNQTGDFDISVGATITNPGDLRIEGAGQGSTIIDPDDADRIFDVFPTDVAATFELEGMTVRDGTAPAGEDGGGIRANQALDITLNSVTLDQNTAHLRGGGVNVVGGNLDVIDSAIQNNVLNVSSSSDYGGGIFANLTTVDVIDSSVTGNDVNRSGVGSSAGASGGGILAINGALNLTRSTVDANRLDMLSGAANTDFPDGGGVYTRNSDVNVTDSAITNNVITGGQISAGAGLYFWDSDASDANDINRILNSTFSGNSATGSSAEEHGAGLYVNGGINEVYFSTFTGNTADTGESIYSVGQATQNNRVLNLRASIFMEDGVECDHPNNLDPTTVGYNVDQGTSCTDNPVGGSIGDQRNTVADIALLASNGGPTQTHALNTGSPAIDVIPIGDCLKQNGSDNEFDQRGIPRPADGDAVPGSSCDVGAYERALCNSAAITMMGTGADETINGTAGNDVIAAEGGADTINAGDGADTICGGNGGDTIRTGPGNDADTAIGGVAIGNDVGTDTISYSDLTAGLTSASLVSLPTSTATGPDAGSDTLAGFENLVGTNLDDGTALPYLQGNSGVNSINGGDGNDRIRGLGGGDTLTGGIGTDTVDFANGLGTAGVTASLAAGTSTSTSEGNDTLSGFEGMIGTDFADNLTGSSGPNDIDGAAGSDILDGHGDDDVLHGGANAAGAGDTVSFQNLTAGVNASLGPALGNLGSVGQGADTGDGIESLTGSTDSDDLSGDTGSNTLDGGDGNDLLDDGVNAIASEDVFIGGPGTDDRVSYLARTDAGDTVTLNLNQVADNAGEAGENDDVQASVEGALTGAGADLLIGNGGVNTFSAGGNDDTLDGRGGADVLVGEGGSDTVTYANAAGPVSVDLFFGATGAQGNDFLSLNENITGSPNDDTLTGHSGPNTLSGLGGADTLDGRENADSLIGGDQVDTASYADLPGPIAVDLPSATVTGQGTDALTTVESFVGTADDDEFIDLFGAPNGYDGGGGIDLLDFDEATAGVNMDLATGAGSDGTSEVNVESLAGSDFGDTLTGDAGDNLLDGEEGADTVTGGLGQDDVFGGLAADTLLVRDGIGDAADCGAADGVNDNVQSDLQGTDTIANCEGGDVVIFQALPVENPPDTTPTPPATKKPKCKKGRKLKKVKGKFKCVKRKRKK
jgi:Ca2+-binding RTX toxin-like protein